MSDTHCFANAALILYKYTFTTKKNQTQHPQRTLTVPRKATKRGNLSRVLEIDTLHLSIRSSVHYTSLINDACKATPVRYAKLHHNVCGILLIGGPKVWLGSPVVRALELQTRGWKVPSSHLSRELSLSALYYACWSRLCHQAV